MGIRTFAVIALVLLATPGVRAAGGGVASVASVEPSVASSPAVERIGLFDGRNFDAWVRADGGPVGWTITDDAMEIAPGTGSIMTRESYRDFTLHLEFAVPESPASRRGQGRGNSGVYLQRRYEVQILDSWGQPAARRSGGALYDARAPDENACRPPGAWQTYVITFRSPRFEVREGEPVKTAGARITVVHNGVTIHRDVELTDKTGRGAAEGPEPGPILLQDHGSPVRFRRIWIEPR